MEYLGKGRDTVHDKWYFTLDNSIETGFRQRTNGSEALNPASDGVHSGQLIEEPSLSTILGI